MIRRMVGDEFWLFTQHDHALLSGQLAADFGNDHFDRPDPRERVILAIGLHDCGWPLHDDSPTLNPAGEPLDVFETPPQLGLKVWSETARVAAARNPYAGMLASLHALSLSNFAVSQSRGHFNWNDPRMRFEVNKFQHNRVEMHDTLRNLLGMRTDIPLANGLAMNSPDPDEQRLIFNFRLLQAMDKLSLNICFAEPPFPQIPLVPTRIGQPCISMTFLKRSAGVFQLDAWPFEKPRIVATVPYRAVPATAPYADDEALRRTYADAPVKRFEFQIVPAGC